MGGRHEFVCLYCGEKFRGNRKRRKFCSRVCASKKWWVEHPERKEWLSMNSSTKRPEVRELIRLSKLGDKNPAKRPEVRRAIAITVGGLYKTRAKKPHEYRNEETWEKIRKSLRKGGYKNCLVCREIFWVAPSGLETEKYCSKRCYDKSKVGEENPNWRGGTSHLPYPYEFDEELKQTVRVIWGNVCAFCSEEPNGENLSTHHIDYNKKNNELSNLLPLCRNCHSYTLSKRNFWLGYFRREVLPIVFVY